MSGDNQNVAPLTGLPLLVAGITLALANFIVVLDLTVANVSVPHIAGSLSVTSTQGTWVITSYAIAEAVSVPLTGWLSARVGAVRLFITALIGFGLFSLLCGLSPNLQALLMFRVAQGLCGGPIMPMAQTLLLRVFGRARAPAALGIWSVATALAPVMGPIVGGTISDQFSWPWIFFLNLPVVALCVGVSLITLGRFETLRVQAPIDFVGLGLLVLWVGCFQIMLDKGREEDWFASPFITTMAVLALISFLAFLIWEWTEAHPIVDLRLFKNRGFAIGVVTQSILFSGFFASFVLIPLFLQTNLGYTATWAGYVAASSGIIGVLFAPVAARLTARFDLRLIVAFGGLWLGSTVIARSFWITNVDFFDVTLPQAIQGVGMPFFFIGTTALALSTIAPKDTASAAGILSFVRSVAGAVAVSIATTRWEHAIHRSQAELAGILHPQELLDQAGANGLSMEQARALLLRLVESESITLATNQIFLWCGLALVTGACVVWFAPPARQAAGPGGGH